MPTISRFLTTSPNMSQEQVLYVQMPVEDAATQHVVKTTTKRFRIASNDVAESLGLSSDKMMETLHAYYSKRGQQIDEQTLK